MVDFSKTEEHPVDSSTAGHLNLGVVEETGNVQKTQIDMDLFSELIQLHGSKHPGTGGD